MKRFFKSIIQNAVKLFISFAPQKDMTGHFYRARLFMLGQFQKLMMQRIRTEEHNGHLLSFVAPNYLSDWRAQTFSSKEPETLDWIDSMQDGGILWDVGANIGVYSLYAGKSKNAKVFSFEPSASRSKVLFASWFIVLGIEILTKSRTNGLYNLIKCSVQFADSVNFHLPKFLVSVISLFIFALMGWN